MPIEKASTYSTWSKYKVFGGGKFAHHTDMVLCATLCVELQPSDPHASLRSGHKGKGLLVVVCQENGEHVSPTVSDPVIYGGGEFAHHVGVWWVVGHGTGHE